ncbi:MAG: ribonuclease P protein component [Christensenellaceae bacterium]
MEYRLKKAKDFDRVFRAGKRAFTNRLTLIYLPAKTVKAGYAVGKKHGKAVKRNRIKRLLREASERFPNGELVFSLFESERIYVRRVREGSEIRAEKERFAEMKRLA